MKPFLFAILVFSLTACGKQGSESKSHASSVAIGHSEATIVYYSMPG
jgi:uncharacterized lipoprotein YehR (DUF1307 family)